MAKTGGDHALALRFTELYSQVYLRLHRRRSRGEARLTSQQWSVLQHLSLTGPLTISECTRHLGRAQSVVSAIVDGLERRDLLARMRDARDRRRVLVWLTAHAEEVLARERQVLDVARLTEIAGRLRAADRQALLTGMLALVRAAEATGRPAVKESKR